MKISSNRYVTENSKIFSFYIYHSVVEGSDCDNQRIFQAEVGLLYSVTQMHTIVHIRIFVASQQNENANDNMIFSVKSKEYDLKIIIYIQMS